MKYFALSVVTIAYESMETVAVLAAKDMAHAVAMLKGNALEDINVFSGTEIGCSAPPNVVRKFSENPKEHLHLKEIPCYRSHKDIRLLPPELYNILSKFASVWKS